LGNMMDWEIWYFNRKLNILLICESQQIRDSLIDLRVTVGRKLEDEPEAGETSIFFLPLRSFSLRYICD